MNINRQTTQLKRIGSFLIKPIGVNSGAFQSSSVLKSESFCKRSFRAHTNLLILDLTLICRRPFSTGIWNTPKLARLYMSLEKIVSYLSRFYIAVLSPPDRWRVHICFMSTVSYFPCRDHKGITTWSGAAVSRRLHWQDGPNFPIKSIGCRFQFSVCQPFHFLKKTFIHNSRPQFSIFIVNYKCVWRPKNPWQRPISAGS